MRKLLGRAARFAAALRSSPAERAKLVRELVEKVIFEENRIVIKMRRGALLGGDVPLGASEQPSDSAVELTAAIDLQAARRRNEAGAARIGAARTRPRDVIRR